MHPTHEAHTLLCPYGCIQEGLVNRQACGSSLITSTAIVMYNMHSLKLKAELGAPGTEPSVEAHHPQEHQAAPQQEALQQQGQHALVKRHLFPWLCSAVKEGRGLSSRHKRHKALQSKGGEKVYRKAVLAVRRCILNYKACLMHRPGSMKWRSRRPPCTCSLQARALV